MRKWKYKKPETTWSRRSRKLFPLCLPGRTKGGDITYLQRIASPNIVFSSSWIITHVALKRLKKIIIPGNWKRRIFELEMDVLDILELDLGPNVNFWLTQSKSKTQSQELCMLSSIVLLLTLIGHDRVFIQFIILFFNLH